MEYTKVTSNHISQLISVVGKQYVFFDEEKLEKYSHDETEDFKFFPEVVVLPQKAEEISQILKMTLDDHLPKLRTVLVNC